MAEADATPAATELLDVPTDGAALARWLGAALEGESRPLRRLASAHSADGSSAVVVGERRQAEALAGREVGVVVAPEGLELPAGIPVIRVADTRLALAQLSRRFDARPPVAEGVHPGAAVHPRAVLDAEVSLGARAVVEAGAVIGRGSRIGAGTVVGAGARLGPGCVLHPNVTLYPGVVIGARVTLHAGAVIGADGFGYAPSPRGALKIHHLGGVRLGDDVEIGANSCVDRGTLEDTVVGARTKIDNLCQIGHNVTIGQDCLIAGMVGVAGSTRIGDRVLIGGSAGVADHLTIGDGARISARAGVTKNVPAGETWAGFPAEPYAKFARRLYLQGRLEQLWQAFKSRG